MNCLTLPLPTGPTIASSGMSYINKDYNNIMMAEIGILKDISILIPNHPSAAQPLIYPQGKARVMYCHLLG